MLTINKNNFANYINGIYLSKLELKQWKAKEFPYGNILIPWQQQMEIEEIN